MALISRSNRTIVAALGGLTAAALLTACGAPAVTPASPPAVAPQGLTPLTLAPIGDPLVVPGSDGRTHVEYDVLVTNVFTAPVTLTSVEVRDRKAGTPVLTLSGPELAARTQQNFIQRPVTPAAQIPVSGQVAVEVDIALPAGAEPPAELDHAFSWSVPADAPALSILDGRTTGQVTGLPRKVSPIEPVRISAPLRGGGWWSLQGCCEPNGHRSLRYSVDGQHEIKSEMFAVDWVRLENGAFFAGDGSSNDQYSYIGADELAVADGTVVATRDGLPNEAPQVTPAKNVKVGEDYIGNSVVIRIAPDRFAVYGHMQPGSVTVRPGDTVKAGDVVGTLGNSGNSTSAHLHFVITDGPDFLTATSIPFVIDSWTLQGTAALPDAPGPIPTTGPAVPQSGTHPLFESVSDFG
ncbi:M23 family metallopeptidase [Pseudonocardia ailaonensis]|uniref:M23 family metallopeptidase n=1 Tax=Pseudonocardia ailaonensis TaxID=367279 RepID=A0ABN2MVC1_9PSEU